MGAADNARVIYQRGVMPLVIMSLLRKEDMYGYQLVHEINHFSSGIITTQLGSLYPVLYKLQEQGFISERKELVGKRMTRVYYHLESKGEIRLQQLIQDYKKVAQGVFQIIQEGERENVSE